MTEASIRTYQELQECGDLDGARNIVYMAFREGDNEGTAGGISGVLKTKGIEMSTNNVSARICELCSMCLLFDSGEKCRVVSTGRLQTVYYTHDKGKKFVRIKRNMVVNKQSCPHCGKLIL